MPKFRTYEGEAKYHRRRVRQAVDNLRQLMHEHIAVDGAIEDAGDRDDPSLGQLMVMKRNLDAKEAELARALIHALYDQQYLEWQIRGAAE